MSIYALPILYTLLLWWFSTGLILYLDGLPRRTFRWSLGGATALLAAALYGLALSSAEQSPFGAYLAFTCGLLVWAWQEMAFLMGFVTGPRREPCPPESRGWSRAGYALQTIIYHELALVALAAAVIMVTRDGVNQVGTWTYMILWALRQSAKLNVFLGVRNLNEEFLPEHLRYLQTYFTRKAMNLLFPLSITLSTIATVWLWQRAFAAGATPFQATGLTFLGTLLTLAVLEHWLLVLPLPADLLWRWGLRSRAATAPASRETQAGSTPPPPNKAGGAHSISLAADPPCALRASP